MIRPMTEADWPTVASIYGEALDGDATFETDVPEWGEWDAAHLRAHRLVAEVDGEVVGWAALAPVSRRAAYRGVAENSVYVRRDARGRGVGRALLAALVAGADAAGIWTIQCSILPTNEASLRLHERAGFRVVGHRERIARHRGAWSDTLLLERRAPGVD